MSARHANNGKAKGTDAAAYSRQNYGTGGSKRARLDSQTLDDWDDVAPSSAPSAAHAAGEGPGYRRPTASEIYPEIVRERKRSGKRRRILGVIGGIVAALVLAGGAYAAWFVHSLDAALAPDDDTLSQITEVLTPTISGDPFYMLLIGSDSREGSWSPIESERTEEHSDVILLARIDPGKKKVTLLSIPRDTPYTLSDGSLGKINEVYTESGAAGLIRAVVDVTGANVSHFAEVHVSGLEAVVELLGGVTVDVPIDLSYVTTDNEDVTVKAGRHKLNGKEAQIFARARHDYETDQDVHRQDAVRQLLIAIINETLDRPLAQIPGVVLQEAQYVDTDLKSGDIVGLASSFAGGGDMTVYTGTGPTNGDVNPNANDQWMCFENPEGWEAVMKLVDAGEEPDGVDYASTEIPWSAATVEEESYYGDY